MTFEQEYQGLETTQPKSKYYLLNDQAILTYTEKYKNEQNEFEFLKLVTFRIFTMKEGFRYPVDIGVVPDEKLAQPIVILRVPEVNVTDRYRVSAVPLDPPRFNLREAISNARNVPARNRLQAVVDQLHQNDHNRNDDDLSQRTVSAQPAEDVIQPVRRGRGRPRGTGRRQRERAATAALGNEVQHSEMPNQRGLRRRRSPSPLNSPPRRRQRTERNLVMRFERAQNEELSVAVMQSQSVVDLTAPELLPTEHSESQANNFEVLDDWNPNPDEWQQITEEATALERSRYPQEVRDVQRQWIELMDKFIAEACDNEKTDANSLLPVCKICRENRVNVVFDHGNMFVHMACAVCVKKQLEHEILLHCPHCKDVVVDLKKVCVI